MTCRACVSTDGMPYYPMRGLAPHKVEWDDSIGKWVVVFSPKEEWPNFFIPDGDGRGYGTWVCPSCFSRDSGIGIGLTEEEFNALLRGRR